MVIIIMTSNHDFLMRYLLMHLFFFKKKRYLPSAGFEISDTTRYNGVQGCVISTRQWFVGDEVFKCTGMIACLKPRDYHQLIESGRDFSVMYSQRKNSNCLFLGPARFMNVSNNNIYIYI